MTRINLKKGLFLFLLVGLTVGFSLTAQAVTNLISNADFSSVGINGLPTDWVQGHWGGVAFSFKFPVSGAVNSKGAQVTISSKTSAGDAKWAWKPVPVTAGQAYKYSDSYLSNVSTFLTNEYTMTDGSLTYKDLATPGPAATFMPESVTFTAPANAVAVRTYHLINQVGSLTISNVSLVATTSTSTPPSPPPVDSANLIQNPSLEVAASSLPQSWARGRWGNNTTIFTYPVAGEDGAKAARIEMSAYSSGDAKWYPVEVPVNAGETYQFSDWSRSSIPTTITLQFRLNNGAYQYLDLGTVFASSAWQQFTKPFDIPSGAVGLTIFHIIKNVGWVETDNYVLKKLSTDPTKFNQGMVSFNFDDGWQSVYDNAVPILDQAGYKGTMFIISERLAPEFTGYMKTDELLSLQSRGYEIAGHTETHPYLTTLDVSAATQEISGGRQDLLKFGLSPVNVFAYPYGDYNQQTEQLVQKAGFIAARSTDTGYNLKTQDPYTLKRQGMIATSTLSDLQGYVNKAMADKTWLILDFHEINNSGNQYSTSPQLFQQTVNYIKQVGAKVVTVSQGLQLMK